ncbi:EF-hand domain-containing protein [Azospirillum soli]|uniref:EF-hand domain-containing protein n=1 Tax=Azospirillum soli TaxID=1304799 RepID=UPI001AE36CBD|nr:EF-hand domain-containing protein [Azospirillum soli]MBP2311297.1 Ca2+-binding EF-hand superfamily protein [Azospirillum soli]
MAARANPVWALFAGALLSLVAPALTGALAADLSAERNRTAKIFELLDEDGNGRISMTEFKNNQMLVFYVLDRNKDLALTRNETALSAEVFARVAGPDGKISTFEFLNAVDSAFNAADTNHDEALDQQEFFALVQHVREE